MILWLDLTTLMSFPNRQFSDSMILKMKALFYTAHNEFLGYGVTERFTQQTALAKSEEN